MSYTILYYIVPYFLLLALNYRSVREWNFITRTNIFSKRRMNVNVNVIRSPDSLGSELEDLKLIHILPSDRHQARSGLARIEHVEIGGTLSRNNLQNITRPRPGGVSCPVSSLHVLTVLLFHCEVDCKDINNVPVPSHAEPRGKIQCRGQNISFYLFNVGNMVGRYQ